MSGLPDFAGLAIFAKVVELRSFAAAAAELRLSKATVSKAVARVEARLGARLLNRTSRRLAPTAAGRAVAARAAQLLAAGEAVEREALEEAEAPRGLVRLAAPMSFGLDRVAPLLPEFFAEYPEIAVDLHLSDAAVDLVGDGFDLALRIAALPDSSLRARRLCAVPRLLVGAPAYLARRGPPDHPRDLAGHACLGYAYLPNPDIWRFTAPSGEEVAVRPRGPLCANNGDALLPALHAGLGLAVLPDFIVAPALGNGRLVAVLPGWSLPPAALHLLSPPGGPRPARVEALAAFFARRLASR